MPTLSERVRAYVAEIDANSKPSIPDDYPGFARELAEAGIEARRMRAVTLRAELNDMIATLHELELL
jgi:predicted  nucleic acid-binding Zn-ribbon protein